MEKKILNGSILPAEWCIRLATKEINDTVNDLKLWRPGRLVWSNVPVYTTYYIGYDGRYGNDLPALGYVEIDYSELVNSMNPPIKYRIMTYREFVSRYGNYFHGEVEFGWNSGGQMDYLYGRELSPKQFKEIKDKGLTRIEGWNISRDMITSAPKPITSGANMFWGDVELKVIPSKGIIETEYGIIHKEELHSILDKFTSRYNFKNIPFDVTLNDINDIEIAIGCQKGTIGKLKTILALLNE